METDHIKWHKFKKETVDFILGNYMNMTAKEISKEVNISPKAINQILRQHGIKPLDGHAILHLEDYEKFKNMYPVCTIDDLCNSFPYIPRESFHSIANKIGVHKEGSLKQCHYTDEDLISFYIDAYNKVGRILTDDEHVLFSIPSAQTYRKHFENRKNLCEKCGIDYKRYSTKIFGREIGDNTNDSFSEKIIEDILHSLNLNYVYNVSYSKYFGIKEFGNRRVDFILTDNDIVIEFFGLIGNKKYEEKMKTKIDLCKKYNIKLVSIYPKDIRYKNFDRIKQILLNKINQVS